jgi:type II secretory pathway pseudopilin PulG
MVSRPGGYSVMTTLWTTFDCNHDGTRGKRARGYAWKIENDLRLQYSRTVVWSVQRILSYQRKMRRTAANSVRRLLSNAQKEYRTAVCTETTEQAENYPNFICIIITGDESWVFGYDPEAKQQSSQWTQTSPRPKKARQLRSNVQSMLIFFYVGGIVHTEFVPPGQTVSGIFYCDVLGRLRDNIRRKCPDKWRNNS